MRAARLAVGLAAVAAVLVLALSGGSASDPRTPAGPAGLPVPFLGVAIVGSGGATAAVDAYGNVVDLREGSPAGPAAIAVSAERQAAGTVAASEAIVARVRSRESLLVPLWRAERVRQRYLPGSNVLRTVAIVGGARAVLVLAGGEGLACTAGGQMAFGGRRCLASTAWIEKAARADRRWLDRAEPLASGAPRGAWRLYRRSLLALRALTDRGTGAVAAGARDGWAFVWPRDAAAVAMAFASAGYGREARRVALFLSRLDLSAAARFHGSGEPVAGRAAQGDASGWATAAARATGLSSSSHNAQSKAASTASAPRAQWQDRADYQEGERGDYLGNAIATSGPTGPPVGASGRGAGGWIASMFGTRRGLVRTAGDRGSGLDSAAAWAVRPFPVRSLFPAVRRTLLRLVARRASRFGISPGAGWHGGDDPWTAPTAWTAWALAALAREDGDVEARRPVARKERRAALSLMADLRRAATPLGLLPERVDAHTGLPTSTTPLAWSHAFAVLALRELWPGRAGA
jgi:hypothetical protein